MTTITISLLQQNLEGIDQSLPLLTLREREIELLCHLKTNPTENEIGDEMCIAPKSVENYKKRIADKLGLKGRRAVVNCVLKNYKLFEELSQYFIKPAQRAEKQPTANSQQPTANSQQPTANSRPRNSLKRNEIEGIIPSWFEGIECMIFSF